MLSELYTVCQEYDFDYYFKSSFDKQNRTSIHAKRTRHEKLLNAKWCKDRVGCKVLTDVHETKKQKKRPIVDVLQIHFYADKQIY